MNFDEFAVAQAAGIVLARNQRLADDLLGRDRRRQRVGRRLDRASRCAHRVPAMAAIDQARAADAERITIATAAASGGRTQRFGLSTEPGSMQVLVPAGGGDHGGLRAGQRNQARAPASSSDPAPAAATPKIAALVLAAGRSRRMAGSNKLLAEIDGKPVVRCAVDAALASHAHPVVVVIGHEHERVSAALDGTGAHLAHNPDFASGLASSLRTGLAALPDDCDGVIVLLGDMPLIRPGHIDRILDAFAPAIGRSVVVPVHAGQRGNPVLWARRFFPEMAALDGDEGARRLLRQYPEAVFELALDDAAVLTDVDTAEALAAARPLPDKS